MALAIRASTVSFENKPGGMMIVSPVVTPASGKSDVTWCTRCPRAWNDTSSSTTARSTQLNRDVRLGVCSALDATLLLEKNSKGLTRLSLVGTPAGIMSHHETEHDTFLILNAQVPHDGQNAFSPVSPRTVYLHALQMAYASEIVWRSRYVLRQSRSRASRVG